MPKSVECSSLKSPSLKSPSRGMPRPETCSGGRSHQDSSWTNSLQLKCCPRYSRHLLPTCCQQRRGCGEPKKRRPMRRADRLFQIIQVLRRTRKPLTADAIAAELETSKRTIYRDIATLMAQRVPIRGEAGMGYILEKGFDLPPLMLTPDEIEGCRARRAMGRRPCRYSFVPRRARPDFENRRYRP